MKKGKLIIVDGIDGSGKSTQIKKLLEHLQKIKKRIYLTDFPQYEKSFFGKMIRRYLKGDFGQTNNTDPHLISLLYALDRFEAKKEIKKHLEEGKIVISDRYSPANKIHQAIKIKNKADKEKFYKWLNKMEFQILDIPKPDLIIFLDTPPKITKRLMISRGKRDMHETDDEHQKQAYKQCINLTNKFRNWKKIKCVEKGKLMPPEVIHQNVWQEIKKII
ncbi:MAG: dTMP kinase [Patescibacteria group bacterium]|nr:dTMP kinase [Patescibacteria group bacterium]